MFFHTSRTSVLISGICALILSLGIARYSLTPMIPHMWDVGVTESVAGWLAGLNYMGYLTGLFIVWLIGDLRLKDFFYRYGLLVAVIATAAMAAHDNRIVWYASRFFAGVTSATGFMLGSGLIINWLHHHNHKQELGIHFSGLGLGIVVSALVVDATTIIPVISENWRLQWLTLAGVGFLLMIPAMLLLPLPREDEIEMSRLDNLGKKDNEPSTKWLVLMSAAYFCAGFSNTVNVTFTSIIAELMPLANLGEFVWLVVGLSATLASFFWDRFSKNIGNLNALKLAFGLNVIGNLVLSMSTNLYTTSLAAILFGFTFMGIVSLTLSTVASAMIPDMIGEIICAIQ